MAPPLAFFSGPLPWLALAAVTILFLWVDLHFFARGRDPTFREGVWWSVGWLVVSLLAAVVVLVLSDLDDAVTYTTVYFIERSLSLDNLFVFILIFTYFGVPESRRATPLFWGIVAALPLRGLAYRVLRGVEDDVDPDGNLMVRAVRRLFPVAGEYHAQHWFVRIDGRRYARRSSSASWRSSRPTSRSRSTPSRRRSRSRGTPS